VPKYLFSIAGLSIAILIVFFSTACLSFPQSTDFMIGIDKIGHIFAYFCFSLSILGSSVVDWKLKNPFKMDYN